MINVMIVEDDLFIGDTITSFIEMQSNIEVVARFNNMEQLIETEIESLTPPDVVLLDIVLPGLSGIKGVGLIKARWPETAIIMCSVMDDGFSVFQSLCAGAVGYITKDFNSEGLLKAIEDVYKGMGSMSPAIARKVAEYFHPIKSNTNVLTPREEEIVNGIIEGASYKLMAQRFDISIDTVRKHIKNIYKKIHVNSKVQLVNHFNRNR